MFATGAVAVKSINFFREATQLMHIRHKRTLAAIAALSTTSLGLMALSTSSADAVSGIDFTITSNNAASVLVPVDGHGTYFIKNAAVGDVLTFTNTSASATRSQPSPRRTLRPARPARGVPAASPSPTSAVPSSARSLPTTPIAPFTLANYALPARSPPTA